MAVEARTHNQPTSQLAVAIAVPLGLVGAAYALSLISNQLLYIGPLDRAAFGWIVVIPLWLSAPVVGGLLWGRLTSRQAKIAASVFGLIVSVAATLQVWQWIGVPLDCGCGVVSPAIDYALPAVLLGVIVGAGLAISGLIASALARAHYPWWAIGMGAGAEVVLGVLAIAAAVAVFQGHVCYVPPAHLRREGPTRTTCRRATPRKRR